MNFQNDSSKPVVLYNSISRVGKAGLAKLGLSITALAIMGAAIAPSTIYAWAPQPYCRNGQTVMVTYNESGHYYNTQSGDVAGACPSPTPTPSPKPTATATATPTPTASPSSTPTPCVVTDVKGTLDHSGNHESANPVQGHLENISENSSCSDTVWVDIYGSTQKQHEGDGWLESQNFISQQKIEVPKGKKDISINVPNKDFCWYQVDVVRSSDIKVPPQFNGTDMVDYAFVKDQDSCDAASPTPTPSSQDTIVINNTNNNTNNNTTNVTVVSASSSPQVIAATATPATELPKTGLPLAGVALGGLAPIGAKLKKFRSSKETLSATSIWEQRELSK